MKALICGAAALAAALAITPALAEQPDELRFAKGACPAVDANEIAVKLGFPANPAVLSQDEGSCAIALRAPSRTELELDFAHFAKAGDAAQEFHADVEPSAEKIAGLGEEAVLESHIDAKRWKLRLSAFKGDATVDVVYEGAPVPIGVDKTRSELVAIANALLIAAAKAPVSTIEEPKCDSPGQSDACPIKVDFGEGQERGRRVFTGVIGKTPVWSYSVPVAAGQTVSIHFKGPRGMLGEIDCPGDEGGAPKAFQSTTTAKLAGDCLVSVGIDLGEAHATGPYALTIERR